MENGTYMLQAIELLHIPDENGQLFFGCDQEWFGTMWQRQAGCGPNAATNLLYYLNARQRIQLPFPLLDKASCIRLMETVWKYITPKMMGVHTIQKFANGLSRFVVENNLDLQINLLEFPRRKKARPSLLAMTAFIAAGLAQDAPVAFLNLSNGSVSDLDAWHWVTIVRLIVEVETDTYLVDAYDGDKRITINLKAWSETTFGGGGFVSIAGSHRS